jgi:putative endonuclease
VVEESLRSSASGGTAGKGARGEQSACRYLSEKGWTVIARNFRTARGEVDIVASRSDTLAFIEVKSWKTFGKDGLEYAVGPRKRARILGTARAFLAARPGIPYSIVRFDVILIAGDGGRIDHIEDAFGEVV